MECTRTARGLIAAAALSGGLLVGSSDIAAAQIATAPTAPEAPDTVARSGVSRASQAQRNSILRLYRAYFLRSPDQAGLDHWVREYASGRMTLNGISDFFARSDEFEKRYGSLSNAEFVRLVYKNVLGRVPDSAGENHWTETLRRGMTRGQIMVGFSESPEFQRKTGTEIASPTTPSAEPWANEVLAAINKERAAQGLHPLTMCPPLTRAATAHSADQAGRNFLSHNGSNGSTPDQRIGASGYGGSAWGENVAYGYTSVDQVVGAWMQSSNHRGNLLNPSFSHIGLGRVAASSGTLYWTQDFGGGGTC